MNKQDKPRICEVLGVEVGERFTIKSDDDRICKNMYRGCEIFIDADGEMNFATKKLVEAPAVEKIQHKATILLYTINHPECIVRRKRFTEQEIEDAKAIKRLIKYADGISRGIDNTASIERIVPFAPSLTIDAFPSIAPGESYTLDEIIGEGTE